MKNLIAFVLASICLTTAKAADQCTLKAIKAAQAIAKINGSPNPDTVLRIESLQGNAQYTSFANYYINEAGGSVDFSYKVKIGEYLHQSEIACDALSIEVPQK